MHKRHIATLGFAAALVLGLAGSASAQTSVSTNVETDTIWSGTIILEQPIFVRNGATLTVLAGTDVRGQPRSGDPPGTLADAPGALIVTRSGRIVAEGNANNPIIFTTAAVDNDADGVCDDLDGDTFLDEYPGFDPATCPGACNPDATPTFCDANPRTAPMAPLDNDGAPNLSLWGGVVVLGNAPTNLAEKCGVGYGECQVEGLDIVGGVTPGDAVYGGAEVHDDSGTLKYVSIRHAGDEIASSNELNGLTLGGVGDGTVLDYIEVYCNFDDGIEWFGGTVNGKHLVITFAGDDQFDVDQGYTGVNQFLFAVLPFFDDRAGGSFGSKSGDKGGEWDGDDYAERSIDINFRRDPLGATDDTPWPLSSVAMWNMTMVGTTLEASPDFDPDSNGGSTAGDNRGIQMRNGFAGSLANSIVVNTGGNACLEVSDGDTPVTPGFGSATDNAPNDLIRLVSTTCEGPTALAGAAVTAAANGDSWALAKTGDAASANVIADAGFNGLLNEDASFNPEGDANNELVSSLKSTPLDPRPAFGLIGIGGGPNPEGRGLDRTATYRGAFLRTVPTLWTTGWTVLNIAGLLED
jgi:hypothetical protein